MIGSPLRAVTMVEMIIGILILNIAVAMGIAHFRNTRVTTQNLTENIQFHIEGRKATDRLRDILLDCTEVVKPLEGNTIHYLLVRDIVNQLRIIYLEPSPKPEEGPFRMISYTDDFSAGHVPENRKVLFSRVQRASFTSTSAGLVIVQMSLLDPKGREMEFLLEIPMKNFSSHDPD